MANSIVFLIILIIVGVGSNDLSISSIMVGGYQSVFDQDMYRRIVDPIKCENQMDLLLGNISLSMPFIDASGKIPSGVMMGNHAELGSYYQCLSIQNSAHEMSIEGKYCMMQIPMNKDTFQFTTESLSFMRLLGKKILEDNRLVNMKKQISVLTGFGRSLINRNQDNNTTSAKQSTVMLSWAICIPKVCRPKDVFKYIVSENSNLVKNLTYPDELFCRVPNDKPYSVADYMALSVFSLLALITVASTSYDLYHIFVLHSEKSQISKLYRTFSIYTNTKRLLTFKTVPGALECVEGIRAISMFWVIVGHSYSTTMMTSVYNMSDVLKWLTLFSSTWINSAPLAVDTFFTLSGIFCVYSIVGRMTREKIIKSLHIFYLHRLLRLFPLLSAVILLQASIFHRISDGPMWGNVAEMVAICRDRWWSALLHVQNYVKPIKICLYHTWYLSVDVQLYIISPLVLIFLFGSKRIAWCALTMAILISLIISSTLSFLYNYSAALINLSRLNEMNDYFVNFYINTLTRAPPFFIGMLYGYILSVFKGKKIEMPKLLVSTLWVLTLLLMGVCIFTIYPVMQVDYDNQVFDNFLNAYMRCLWAIALGSLIVACVNGYGGPINWILCLHMWKLPARLSYAIYLIHYPIIHLADSSMVSTYYFSDGNTIYRAMGDTGFTLIAAFLLCIIVDAPFSILHKMLMERAESMPLMTFLQKEFQLQINNNPRESTTKYGTTIDAVFVRYLDNVSSNTFVTYFSYHRPIITVTPPEETSNITITELTDENI